MGLHIGLRVKDFNVRILESIELGHGVTDSRLGSRVLIWDLGLGFRVTV